MKTSQLILRGLTASAAAALIVGAVAWSAGGEARAQISQGGGPIAIGADRLEVIDAERVSIWSGRAEAIQGENRLRADTIRAYNQARRGATEGAGSQMGSEIERMVATGNVYFVTPTQVIRGDEATYTAASDTIVVTGDVILTQGENVLTGSRLTVEVSSGRATMDGAPTDAGRRVRGVFYPDES